MAGHRGGLVIRSKTSGKMEGYSPISPFRQLADEFGILGPLLEFARYDFCDLLRRKSFCSLLKLDVLMLDDGSAWASAQAHSAGHPVLFNRVIRLELPA